MLSQSTHNYEPNQIDNLLNYYPETIYRFQKTASHSLKTKDSACDKCNKLKISTKYIHHIESDVFILSKKIKYGSLLG
jgi:hypothetical protein